MEGLWGTKTILLVEDDELMRSLMREVLEKRYALIEASSYREALLQLSQPFDLAVIDYLLPDGDGCALLKALREKKDSVPGIIITGYSTENIAIEALRAGATDYVRKPMGLRAFARRVDSMLGESGKSEEGDAIITRQELLLESVSMFIENKIGKVKFTIDDAASMANMSRSCFCRAFRQKFGVSFVSYVNNVRTKNAADLLKSDMKLIDIAYTVGFGSVEYFSRFFKKEYGKSPSDYRRQLKITEPGKTSELPEQQITERASDKLNSAYEARH